jgi:hypothetical protein
MDEKNQVAQKGNGSYADARIELGFLLQPPIVKYHPDGSRNNLQLTQMWL